MTRLWHWLVYGPSDEYVRQGWRPWLGVLTATAVGLIGAVVLWVWGNGR